MKVFTLCVGGTSPPSTVSLRRLLFQSSHLRTFVSPSAPVCSTEKAKLVGTWHVGPSRSLSLLGWCMEGMVRMPHDGGAVSGPIIRSFSMSLEISPSMACQCVSGLVWWSLDSTCSSLSLRNESKRIGCAYFMSRRFFHPRPGLMRRTTGNPTGSRPAVLCLSTRVSPGAVTVGGSGFDSVPRGGVQSGCSLFVLGVVHPPGPQLAG